MASFYAMAFLLKFVNVLLNIAEFKSYKRETFMFTGKRLRLLTGVFK